MAKIAPVAQLGRKLRRSPNRDENCTVARCCLFKQFEASAICSWAYWLQQYNLYVDEVSSGSAMAKIAPLSQLGRKLRRSPNRDENCTVAYHGLF